MTPQQFKEELGKGLDNCTIDFEDTMSLISDQFEYTPTAFKNGLSESAVENEAGQNEGSCKIFALGETLELSQEETLLCFGRFYRDVLNTPEGTDHGNIRNFIKDGWEGIQFSGTALNQK